MITRHFHVGKAKLINYNFRIFCYEYLYEIKKENTMVDYKKYENDEDFMDILNYLRCESLKEPDEQGR